jgi:WhiB family transcriptional regulator, redox-sensing transcriptional regulator
VANRYETRGWGEAPATLLLRRAGAEMDTAVLAGDVGQPRVTGLPRGEDWRSASACQDTDPDLFFPVSGSGKSLEQVASAKAICAGCPVQRSCLAFALRTGQVHGIWGGLTEEERRQPVPAVTGVQPTRAPDGAAPLAGAAWTGELIEGQAAAARNACDRMTATALRTLSDSVEEASRMPSQPGWARKAAAYAGTFRLLAEATGDRPPDGTAGLVRDLMTAVGPGANGMIVSAHRRLLAHLRARNADHAARELANHLSALHYMWRISGTQRMNAELASAQTPSQINSL